MKAYLVRILTEALAKITDQPVQADIIIEKPRSADHGDAATNLAMTLTKKLGMPPRKIAEALKAALPLDDGYLSAVEIAGPGFINFRFSEKWLYGQLSEILETGAGYGKTTENAGKKMQIEFVSANPTGPLTVGHGRNAVLGDTIARLLEWTGAAVDREYYFNNAGRQMRVLGESVRARYLQELGQPAELPEDGYQGGYITDIAKTLIDAHEESLLGCPPNDPVFKNAAEHAIFADIRKTLERMNIRMDSFFNEHTLYEDGSIDRVVSRLRELDLAYDADGAVWFRTTKFGKEKDTVLVKSTGEPTYRLPDIAYHINKLDRGYDTCIDIFGADHIATYPDVVSAVEALGYDSKRIDVQVYQFVTIVKEGIPFKMSTRKANFVTLDELMDMVGSDVTRFFFLMRTPGTHLEFDIAEATQQGEKNPVFYLQYAHARIHSILSKATEEYDLSAEADLGLLTHPAETTLIKDLLQFPDMVAQAAHHREPHRLINYLNEVAASFHRFYHDCRIMGEAPELAVARVALLRAVVTVLNNGLTILGIQAPERM
ncbi:MAG: arginine--tRNA ligase [Balneolales bacterium]|nr:arginine--tRNA ligase [Balneolales bacterium]